MKKLLISILFLQSMVALSAGERVIENPQFSIGTHGTVTVEKVTLTDDATLLQLAIWHSPHSWIRIASETYIRVDGKKFIVQSADGIEMDKEVFSDETNITRFTLKFPAIDPKAKTLDFIETDCDGCFKIWGINLDPDAKFVPTDIPQHIREQANVVDDGKSLTVPVFKEGTAVLKGIIPGYEPGMGIEVLAYFESPVLGGQEERDAKVKDDGTFEFSIPLATTTEVLLRFPGYNKYVLLSPGAESTICIDLHQKSYQETRNEALRIPASRYVFWGGANADVNNVMEEKDLDRMITGMFYQDKILTDILGMDAAQYKAYILGQKDELLKALTEMKLPKKAYELAEIKAKNYAAHRLFFAESALSSAYRRANGLKYEDSIPGFKEPVLDEAYYSFIKDLDLNNATGLYDGMYSNNVNSAKYIFFESYHLKSERLKTVNEHLTQIVGTDKGILFDLIAAQMACSGFEENMPLTEEDRELLKQVDSKAIREYAFEKDVELIARIEANKNKKGYTIHDVPAGAGEQVFADIVKPFEGKVVLVDFWATWCAPCRAAMKQFANAKAELKEKGVVFVFVTDETSPLDAWQNMIPDIPGEHYRLTNAQFGELRKKFGIRGVPSYMILNKKGEQVFFSVGFRGASDMSWRLNEELAKE